MEFKEDAGCIQEGRDSRVQVETEWNLKEQSDWKKQINAMGIGRNRMEFKGHIVTQQPGQTVPYRQKQNGI